MYDRRNPLLHLRLQLHERLYRQSDFFRCHPSPPTKSLLAAVVHGVQLVRVRDGSRRMVHSPNPRGPIQPAGEPLRRFRSRAPADRLAHLTFSPRYPSHLARDRLLRRAPNQARNRPVQVVQHVPDAIRFHRPAIPERTRTPISAQAGLAVPSRNRWGLAPCKCLHAPPTPPAGSCSAARSPPAAPEPLGLRVRPPPSSPQCSLP